MPPIPELCILFAYHKCDPLTRYHLGMLRTHNPHVDVIPITDDIPEHLPGTVDVKRFPDLWPTANPWRRCDTMIYRWFINRTLTARRYVYLEYDCLCTVSLREAYAEVWDSEVAARDVRLPGQGISTRQGQDIPREWAHFREIKLLDEEDRPFASGLAPLTCIMFSHDALVRIVEVVSKRDVFCELRLGTAVRRAGLEVKTFPPSLRNSVWWDPRPEYPSTPGLYHAVKGLPEDQASSL